MQHTGRCACRKGCGTPMWHAWPTKPAHPPTLQRGAGPPNGVSWVSIHVRQPLHFVLRLSRDFTRCSRAECVFFFPDVVGVQHAHDVHPQPHARVHPDCGGRDPPNAPLTFSPYSETYPQPLGVGRSGGAAPRCAGELLHAGGLGGMEEERAQKGRSHPGARSRSRPQAHMLANDPVECARSAGEAAHSRHGWVWETLVRRGNMRKTRS